MNVTQRLLVWDQFKFQLPMIICAVFVLLVKEKSFDTPLKVGEVEVLAIDRKKE